MFYFYLPLIPVKRALIFIFLFSWVLSGFTLHEFYVSLCRIDHNPETRALEITMKIFTDDLEYGITGSKDFYGLGTRKEPVGTDSLIFSYILENFEIVLDRKVAELIYIGKEVELDVTWIYIEIENVPELEEIEITNRMLTELFYDQVNIINVNYNQKTLGLLLKQDKPTGSLEF
jgi:hypothetical protein